MNIANLIGFYTDLEEAISSKKIIKYLLSEDNVYQLLENEIGIFTTEAKTLKMGLSEKITPVGSMNKVEINGVEYLVGLKNLFVLDEDNNLQKAIFPKQQVESNFTPKLSKIPKILIQQIASFFKDICSETGTEVMVEVWYDKEKKEYFIDCPEQTVSMAHISYQKDQEKIMNPNLVSIMDIHSHNTMGAFFSGTDDGDEKETKFYGVLGYLNKDNFAFLFRTYVLETFLYLTPHQIFDIETLEDLYLQVEYPSEWRENVKRKTYSYPKTNWWSDEHPSSNVSKGYYGYELEEEYYGQVSLSGFSPIRDSEDILAQFQDGFYYGENSYRNRKHTRRNNKKSIWSDVYDFENQEELDRTSLKDPFKTNKNEDTSLNKEKLEFLANTLANNSNYHLEVFLMEIDVLTDLGKSLNLPLSEVMYRLKTYQLATLCLTHYKKFFMLTASCTRHGYYLKKETRIKQKLKADENIISCKRVLTPMICKALDKICGELIIDMANTYDSIIVSDYLDDSILDLV